MRLSGFLFALLLAWPAAVRAQDLSGKWQWIDVDAAAKWFVIQGEADVTFANGKFTAHLRDGEFPKWVRFELTGTLTKTKPPTGFKQVAYGTISAKVTRMNSGMSPNIPFHGDYVRTEFSNGGAVAEYITLTDGFNFIGLKRGNE
jgi:hypothetical protein